MDRKEKIMFLWNHEEQLPLPLEAVSGTMQICVDILKEELEGDVLEQLSARAILKNAMTAIADISLDLSPGFIAEAISYGGDGIVFVCRYAKLLGYEKELSAYLRDNPIDLESLDTWLIISLCDFMLDARDQNDEFWIKVKKIAKERNHLGLTHRVCEFDELDQVE